MIQSRSFEVKKDEAEGGVIFAVLDQHEVFEGKDPYWAKHVEEGAKALGFYSDETGRMMKPADYEKFYNELHGRIQTRMDAEIPV